MPDYPNVDNIVRQGLLERPRSENTVDIILVNPPTPDRELWIHTQHRVGRRTRENMVWLQVPLAQMAALFHPTFKVQIIDPIVERMSWSEVINKLVDYQPRYNMPQLTAPTLENDMYGCFLAKACLAITIIFGTHVTPLPHQTMNPYPSLVKCWMENRLTIRDLLDHFEGKIDERIGNPAPF